MEFFHPNLGKITGSLVEGDEAESCSENSTYFAVKFPWFYPPTSAPKVVSGF